MKPRTCETCQTIFTPQRMGARACSPMCAIRLVKAEKKTKAQAKKAERKADVEKLAKLAPLRKLLKDAQTAFNAFIRERDRQAGHPCISSGRPLDWSGNQVDAGHYRSVGAASHLRFHEDNVHAQSKHDNLWESGNAVEYRLRLIERIGLSRIEALEADNVPKKWRREEVIAIKEQYAAKLRELKKA